MGDFDTKPIVGGVARRFSLGVREFVLIIVAGVAIVTCIALAAALGVAKNEQNASNGIIGDACLTRVCLEASSYNLINMNASADPCDDFYQYACGNRKLYFQPNVDNPERTVINDMERGNRHKLKSLLESPVPQNKTSSSERKLKDLYASCLDDYQIEVRKGTPITSKILHDVGGWYVLGNWNKRAFNLNTDLKKIHSDYGVNAFFDIQVGADLSDSTKQMIQIIPGGVSRVLKFFHYINQDPTEKIRNAYTQFMRTVAELVVRDSKVNVSSATKKQKIDTFVNDVFSIETNITQLAMSNVSILNPSAAGNQITLGNLNQQTSNAIDWVELTSYIFKTAGITSNTKVAVPNKEYLSAIGAMIKNLPSSNSSRILHNYLVWRLFETYVPDLSAEYVNADRKFLTTVLGARPFFLERWRTCLSYVQKSMKEALGALFVGDHFADKNKDKVTDITNGIKQTFINMVMKTSWMDDTTRKTAKDKISAMTYKLGYPDIMMNQTKLDQLYISLSINKSDFMQNKLNVNQFRKAYLSTELKAGVDGEEWRVEVFDTYIQTIPNMNEIIVTAGLLQFPIYGFYLPHYMTFGGIGPRIGSHMVNLIGEKGRQWDKSGKYFPTSWWSSATSNAYTNVRGCYVNLYNISQQIGLLGEKTSKVQIKSTKYAPIALALTSGIRLAYNAYKQWEQINGVEKIAPTAMGLSNEQMFFLNFAQSNCASRDDTISYDGNLLGISVREDTRVNLAVRELDEFSKAFKCKPTARMNPRSKCITY